MNLAQATSSRTAQRERGRHRELEATRPGFHPQRIDWRILHLLAMVEENTQARAKLWNEEDDERFMGQPRRPNWSPASVGAVNCSVGCACMNRPRPRKRASPRRAGHGPLGGRRVNTRRRRDESRRADHGCSLREASGLSRGHCRGGGVGSTLDGARIVSTPEVQRCTKKSSFWSGCPFLRFSSAFWPE